MVFTWQCQAAIENSAVDIAGIDTQATKKSAAEIYL
ncbi:MAG: hypothetical protein ACJA1Q_002532 [Pseudohongiellaceae bacterium]|jgi:hypothetical protein